MNNPLLQPFDTPFEVPPFDKIETAHFLPAIEQAIRLADEEINSIASDPRTPTFENTVARYARSGAELDRVLGVFFPLLSALSSDELMEVSNKALPLISEHSVKTLLNEQLWERIKAVHDNPAEAPSDPVDARLLKKTYDSFVNNGANLKGDDRATLRDLAMKLSELSNRFRQNELRNLNAITIDLTDEEAAGIPSHILEEATALADGATTPEGLPLRRFTLQTPTYMAVMKFADSRSVRERFYRQSSTLNTEGEFDNRAVVAEMVALRARLAELLGFSSAASQTLVDRMARTPEGVYDLLHRLLEAYTAPAHAEIEQLTAYARGFEGEEFEMMPWDYAYWSRRLKTERYAYDEQALRPYFKLENVIDGVFGLATKLYGISFRERADLPVYHPDVKAFEVIDTDGSPLGVLYTDFFPRDTKQSGAWMTEFKDQWINPDGTDSRPVVSIVMNFTKPTATEPSLLTPGEVRTFLHEFGHALHGLFSRVKYASLSGTSVSRDFVELPSQFNENFLTCREFLDSFARHYLTGEPLPADDVNRIIESDQFGAAYACMRQLSFGLLDMAWHTLGSAEAAKISADDVEAFETEAMKPAATLPHIPNTMMSVTFGHLFAGGYAAGYYSYKWSEVLDADAFAVFRREGVFSRETAGRFRREILEKGNSEAADILYRRFRGGDATINALLERDGIRIADSASQTDTREK